MYKDSATVHFNVPGVRPWMRELFLDKELYMAALAAAGLPIKIKGRFKVSEDATETSRTTNITIRLQLWGSPPDGKELRELADSVCKELKLAIKQRWPESDMVSRFSFALMLSFCQGSVTVGVVDPSEDSLVQPA